MPIPSLPLEIVGEIASHLRAAPLDDTHDAVRAGQTLSLVCRSWYPLGQALRWRTVDSEIDTIASLDVHFRLYPHLSRLVHGFVQTAPAPEDVTEEEDPELAATFEILAKLISSLTHVTFISVAEVAHVDLHHVLKAASSLPRLDVFSVLVTRKTIWTSQLASVLANGFKSLRSFYFQTTRLSPTEEWNDSVVTRPTPLQLTNLRLAWRSVPTVTPRLLESFLSCINPTTVETCEAIGSCASRTTFSWLETCSNLRLLDVYVRPRDAELSINELIDYLPRMTNLRKLTLVINKPDTFTPFPTSIVSLLSALPSNLRFIDASTFIFSDGDAFPHQQLSQVGRKLRYLLYKSPSLATMLLWQPYDDRSQWFRHSSPGSSS